MSQKITFLTTSLTSKAGYATGKVYNPATDTWVNLGSSVGEVEQAIINFPAFPLKTVVDDDFTITISSNSPAPITVTSANPSIATVTNNNNGTWTIGVIAIGVTEIIATQDLTTGYTEAEDVPRTFVVDAVITAGWQYLTSTTYNGAVTAVPPHEFAAASDQTGLIVFDQYVPADTNCRIQWDIPAGSFALIGFAPSSTLNDIANDAAGKTFGSFSNWQGTGLYYSSAFGIDFLALAGSETKLAAEISAGKLYFYKSVDGVTWIGIEIMVNGFPTSPFIDFNQSQSYRIKARVNPGNSIKNLIGTGLST